MSPPDVFKNGLRQKSWNVKEIPSLSAKLMPEFSQRRNIKDMFKRPTIPRPVASQANTPAATPTVTLRGEPKPNKVCSAGVVAAENTATFAAAQDAMSHRAVAKTESPGKKRKTSETPAPKPTKKKKAATSGAMKAAPSKGQQSLKGFFQLQGPAKNMDAVQPALLKTDPSNTSNSRTSNVSTLQLEAGISPDNANPRAGYQLLSKPQEGGDALHSTPTPTDGAHEGRGITLDRTVLTSGFSLSPQLQESPEAPDNIAAAHSVLPEIRPTQSPSKPMPPRSPSSASVVTTSEEGAELVFDPIVSKESWQGLFRKKAAPLCEGHEEPCKSMLTKKKGENQGRSFWMCARPLGPSGQKEKNTQWRCGTFIWCSDWKGD